MYYFADKVVYQAAVRSKDQDGDHVKIYIGAIEGRKWKNPWYDPNQSFSNEKCESCRSHSHFVC